MLKAPSCSIALVLASLAGCSSGEFTDAEWNIIQTLSPVPELPESPTNKYADDEAAAELGQMLFFDKALSGPLEVASDLGAVGETGKIACVDCHSEKPDDWFSDVRSMPNATSLGATWLPRNSPTMVNLAFYEWFGWGGHSDTLWTKATIPLEHPGANAATRLQLAHVLWDKYREEYNAVFDEPLDPALDPDHPEAARFPATGAPKLSPDDPDGAWEAMTPEDQEIINRIFANVGKAWEAYFRKLVSGNAPFDAFVAGDDEAISSVAKEGLKLFIGKAACVACHSGPMFSDQEFHNTGVPQVGDKVLEVDEGRYEAIGILHGYIFSSNSIYSDDRHTGKIDDVVAVEEDKGAFRTKQLRQIAGTGPFMHTGHLQTLEDVVRFYNEAGGDNGFTQYKDSKMVPLNLTEAEIRALVAFMETLSGEPVPERWRTNTAKP